MHYYSYLLFVFMHSSDSLTHSQALYKLTLRLTGLALSNFCSYCLQWGPVYFSCFFGKVSSFLDIPEYCPRN